MASIVAAASRATTTRASSSVLLAQQRRLLSRPLFVRSLSTQDDDDFDVEDDDLPNKQDFVKVRLEPGEWDTNHTDPIHRPPWKNKAKIISAQDFANRPRAGFRDEFASPYDAMLVLSWLDRPTQEKIYSSYLSLMQTMQDKEQVTSHEYFMRVIAQKYNITASRVAGVVQLLHNEDQIRKQHPEQKIYYDTQEYVDARIAEHIANCYDAFRQSPPEAPFIEDPMGVTGMGNIDRRVSGQEEAGDELDYDELVEKALIREQRDARLAIDNYEYITDVDESTIPIQITADCQKLLKKQEQLKEEIAARPDNMRPLPENGSGEVRKRWKYVAETINTRDQKKKHHRRRRNKLMKNAIVEEDGDLRVASVAEVKTTSWKPERNTQEFTYHGVKQAWLERTLEGKIGGWGRVQRPVQTKKEESEASPMVDEVQVTEGDDVEEGQESSSFEEEEETELYKEEEYNDEEEDDPKKKK